MQQALLIGVAAGAMQCANLGLDAISSPKSFTVCAPSKACGPSPGGLITGKKNDITALPQIVL